MTTDYFVTDTGVRVPAITTAQMREVDRIAVEELGPNLYQMMENAGRNLALAVLATLGDAAWSTPIVVMAGTGGNGGGGICAARHLANRGAEVSVVVSDASRLTSVPKHQLHTYRSTSDTLEDLDGLSATTSGLVVDAIIGYGLSEAPRSAAEQMIAWIGAQNGSVISLDVPSGVDSTTGEAPGAHVRASKTLTLALPKSGLDSTAVGDLWLADIGIPQGVYQRVGVDVPPGSFGDRFLVPLHSSVCSPS